MKNKVLPAAFCFLLVLARGAWGASVPGQALPVWIEGVSYFSVNAFSQERGLHYHWDPLLKNAVIEGGEGAVKFHVDSEYILTGDRFLKLDHRVRFLNGSVMAPSSAVRHLDRLYPAKIAPAGTAVFPSRNRIQTVVIDAGHGGHDLGALGLRRVREKELALGAARVIRDELKARGIEVIMTRDRDEFIPLEERARTANQSGADLFVSVHANASPARSLNGFEVYFLSEATDDAALALERSENSVYDLKSGKWEAPSRDLKRILWDLKESENRRQSLKAAQFVADKVEGSVEIAHRRIKGAGFYVLKWAECPAILVEMGYLTNPADNKRLKNDLYARRLAQSVAGGVLDFKEAFERTDGFTE